MKFKTTKKNMRESYDRIIGIGYCNAQYLLQFEEPIAYSTRAEGWACDYYDIDGVLISTGYAPLDSRHTKHNYDMIHGYELKATEICCGSDSWEDRRDKVKSLLREFVSEASKEVAA